MVEEGPGQALNIPSGNEDDLDLPHNTNSESSLTPFISTFIKDGDYQALRKHFLKEGKGRPPDYPRDLTLTNKLLLQLYVLKEEKSSSFDELRSWLQKLVPSTATVTEGRIKHRIKTLVTTCASISQEDCETLLSKTFNFHALAEPLGALGLNHLHLTGACDFHGLPKANVSNHVVIELENFRSLNREPTTFVNRWLKTLCTPCNSLSAKQLKSRVEKVIRRNRDLSKRRDIAGLDAFG